MHTRLDPILRRQHGVVSRRQCVAAGLSTKQVDHLLATRRFIAVFPGVYRGAAVPTTADQLAMAAVLAGGEGAMASYRLALDVHRMRNYRCSMGEITAPHRVPVSGLLSHRSADVRAERVRGIAVTSPARTLLDCATVIAEPTMQRFIETWLSGGRLTLAALEREIAQSRGHHGAKPLRALLAKRLSTGEDADSPAEMALGELLVRHGLPLPELHHLVTVSSGHTFELDWSYPNVKVAFELDGYGIHLRSLEAFEHDRFRGNELRLDGWQILQFTKRMLTRQPLVVVDQASRALGVRRVVD